MYWPEPSAEFEQAARSIFGGVPWRTQDDRAQRLFYEPFDLARQIYSAISPERRVNDRGEPFFIESHYINGELPLNVSAFHNGQSFCIGYTSTVFTTVEKICHVIFSEPAFQHLLYDASADELADYAKAAELRRPGVEEPVSPIAFTGCDVGDELVDLYDRFLLVITSFAELDDRARSDARLLRNLVLEYILHHEVGHIVHGHVGLIHEQLGFLGIAERVDAEEEIDLLDLRQQMEFQADQYAARSLFHTSRSHSLMTEESPFPRTTEFVCVLQTLALLIAQTVFATLKIARIGPQGNDWEDSVQRTIAVEGLYPSTGVRLINGYVTYMTSLTNACRLGVEGLDPEVTRTVGLKFGALKTQLVYRYNEFTIIGASLFDFSDAIIRQEEAYSESEALTARCAPYAFV